MSAAPAKPPAAPHGAPSGPPSAAAHAPAAPRRGLARLRTWPVMALCGSLAAGGVGTMLLFWSSTSGPTPDEEVRKALQLLDNGKLQEARDIASKVTETDDLFPEFPGAVRYVLGMTAFREAVTHEEADRERLYLVAAGQLREAERRGLRESRRPEWTFGLGVTLFRLGSNAESRPLLEEAVSTHPAGLVEAALDLAQIYLYLNDPDLLARALELNSKAIATAGIPVAERDRALLQRSQILLALGKTTAAEQVLNQVSVHLQGKPGKILIRARASIAEGKVAQALEMLRPVANDTAGDAHYARQASYLMGLCMEKLGDSEAAVSHFERAIKLQPDSPEALAGHLWAGDLQRALQRQDEALEHYTLALKTVLDSTDLSNTWLSEDEFRMMIVRAADEWIAGKMYAEAIALGAVMPPLFEKDEGAEVQARAEHEWAVQLQAEFDKTAEDFRGPLRQPLLDHWNRSGEAMERLAKVCRKKSAYLQARWQSGQDFLQAHRPERALEQLDSLLKTNDTRMRATVLLQRGMTLLSLNRLDDAALQLQQVMDEHRQDPAAFQARYILGNCRLEQQQPALAEATWQGLLAAPELTPEAREWRLSLFSLGKLHYQQAARLQRDGRLAEIQGRAAEATEKESAELDAWNKCAAELQQYLDRYPASAEIHEARHMFADAGRRGADLLRKKLLAAETDNARGDIKRQMQQRLDRALAEYMRLQQDLRREREAGQLNTLGRTLLHNSYLEIGDTLFALERYEAAISAYSSAAASHQLQPETLTAYIQMANCYERLGRRGEARSMFEQARVIHDQIPEAAFTGPDHSLTRAEWKTWLEWARTLNP